MLEENIKVYDQTMEEKNHEKAEIESELKKILEESDTLIQLFKEIDEEKHREKELEEEFKLKKEVLILTICCQLITHFIKVMGNSREKKKGSSKMHSKLLG